MSADINVVVSSEFCIVPVQHENATIEAINVLKHLSSATLIKEMAFPKVDEG